jgi:hypothetical protein
MRKLLLVVVGLAFGAVLALPGAAAASHDSSGAPFDEDFVVGSFRTMTAPTFVVDFTIDAHSGPSGENPTGEVTVVIDGVSETGGVTCLNVTGNRGTIGVDFPSLPAGFFFVEDNDGAGQDAFSAAFTGEPRSVCPADPSTPPSPVLEGDITVHDAPAFPTSKNQCKNGGWRNFGTAFKNEGQCVAFVQRHPQP